ALQEERRRRRDLEQRADVRVAGCDRVPPLLPGDLAIHEHWRPGQEPDVVRGSIPLGWNGSDPPARPQTKDTRRQPVANEREAVAAIFGWDLCAGEQIDEHVAIDLERDLGCERRLAPGVGPRPRSTPNRICGLLTLDR